MTLLQTRSKNRSILTEKIKLSIVTISYFWFILSKLTQFLIHFIATSYRQKGVELVFKHDFKKSSYFRKHFNLLFNGQKPFSSDDRHGLETCSQLNFYCHALWYLSKSNMGGYIFGVASLFKKKYCEFDLILCN